MIPPKMVPRALVSFGIRMTRMAGCNGPGLGCKGGASIGIFFLSGRIGRLQGGDRLHAILGTLCLRGPLSGNEPLYPPAAEPRSPGIDERRRPVAAGGRPEAPGPGGSLQPLRLDLPPPGRAP